MFQAKGKREKSLSFPDLGRNLWEIGSLALRAGGGSCPFLGNISGQVGVLFFSELLPPSGCSQGSLGGSGDGRLVSMYLLSQASWVDWPTLWPTRISDVGSTPSTSLRQPSDPLPTHHRLLHAPRCHIQREGHPTLQVRMYKNAF